MGLLDNKNIIVTGCNRGIGKAIINECAHEGANIYAVVRKESEEFTTYCNSLMQECKISIKPIYADFSDEENVKATICCLFFENLLLREKRIWTFLWKANKLLNVLLSPKLYSLSSCNVLIIDKLETYK